MEPSLNCKSLASLYVSKFLRNIVKKCFLYNFEVDLGSQAGFQQQKRELQGQSSYIFNICLPCR